MFPMPAYIYIYPIQKMTIIFPVRSYNVPLLGIMYLSGFLKRAGHKVCVLSADRRKISEKLCQEKDAVLAYSIMTYEARFFIELNKSIKERFDVPSLFGGPHPTFFPEMIEEPGVDAVCRGEGEQAFMGMIDAIKTKKDITCIQNWWVKKDGDVYKNPLRPLIYDLDDISFPDRSVFKDIYFWHNCIVSRGCPFNCSYCFNHAYRQLYKDDPNHVRRRSVKNIIAELQEMKDNNKFRASWVSFVDSVFINDMAWVRDFSAQYRKKINIPFVVYQRPDLITEEWLDCLKEASCFGIRIGIESGDRDVRKSILNRDMANEQIIRACRLIKRKKLLLKTYNILGIPGSSFNDDWETLKLNIACRPTVTTPFLMEAYPKTKIYSIAGSLGLLEKVADYDFRYPSTLRQSAIKFKNKREKRLTENLQKFFSITVQFPFLAPLVRFLIKFPFGAVYFGIFTLFSVYENHIKFAPFHAHLFTKKMLRNMKEGLADILAACFSGCRR